MQPPKGPHLGLFAGYLGVERGPLVFLYFFISLIHQLDLVQSFWPPWAPLGLNRANFWALRANFWALRAFWALWAFLGPFGP
jgi:hypothetical protein